MLVFFFTAYFYLLQVQANTTSLHFCMCVQSSMHVHICVSSSEIWTILVFLSLSFCLFWTGPLHYWSVSSQPPLSFSLYAVHSVSNSEIWTIFFLYFSSSSAPPFCLSVSSTEIWQLYSYYTLSVYHELDLSITALCVWVFLVLKSEQLSSSVCLSVCLNWTTPSMVYFLILFEKFLNF